VVDAGDELHHGDENRQQDPERDQHFEQGKGGNFTAWKKRPHKSARDRRSERRDLQGEPREIRRAAGSRRHGGRRGLREVGGLRGGARLTLEIERNRARGQRALPCFLDQSLGDLRRSAAVLRLSRRLQSEDEKWCQGKKTKT